MNTVVTHSGSFHADDVFAVAAFQLLLGKENVEVVRTRDDSIIAEADYVVDVGAVYDHGTKRYDHHQPGAPVRENGIPYAGFGLMWRHYGEAICGSPEVAQAIEEKLCQPVDAGDNGVALYTLNDYGVRPFELYNIISSFETRTNDSEIVRQEFLQAVDFARALIERLVAQSVEHHKAAQHVAAVYEAADDKRILLFEESVERHLLVPYPDVMAIVYPADDPERGRTWKVGVVPTGEGAFVDRVKFPLEWAGLRDEELAQVSGIADALFCHTGRWRFVAQSKESAIRAAESAS